MYPIVPMIKGSLGGTDKMKICLLVPLDQDGKQQAVKGRIVSLVSGVSIKGQSQKQTRVRASPELGGFWRAL